MAVQDPCLLAQPGVDPDHDQRRGQRQQEQERVDVYRDRHQRRHQEEEDAQPVGRVLETGAAGREEVVS